MPKKQAKSKYTADRGIPGAFEGETVTRRRFMIGTAHAAGAIATSAFLLPALGFALGPLFEEHELRWQPVGAPDEFPDDTYVPKVITLVDGIGEAGKTTVYIRKRNAEIDTDKLPKGYEPSSSSRSPRAACTWAARSATSTAAQRFICPCHGGVYDFHGKVDGGPPVRPLDRFYNRVRNGQVEIGPRFSVNRELDRFSPRDPGEPLDGIGGILYPSRPTIRKLDSLPQD